MDNMESKDDALRDLENLKSELTSLELSLGDAANSDDFVVDFAKGDSDNPFNWQHWQKWSIVALVSVMSLLDSFATLTIIPAAPQITTEFHVTNDLYTTLLVSIWELGEGIGPFLVGPLSERYGRLPIYHAGNILFILCSIACALSTNISMLVAFRFLNGFVITSLTLGPSIVGDLFVQEERGLAMALATVMPVLGPVGAPIVGAFVAQAEGWRWTIWIIVIAVGAVTLLSMVVFRETYQVTILERKTRRLQKETGDLRWKSKHQKPNTTAVKSFFQGMARPLRMMIFSPIVLIVSLYTAVTYGLSYLVLTTLTEIMETSYRFSQGVVGLAFLGAAMGNIIGLLFYGLTSDRYLKRKSAKSGIAKPEYRLPPMLIGAVTLPVGFFLYGWTAYHRVQWIVPLIGTALIGCSVVLTILPTENYLVDIYDVHSASAVAAGVILRAILGAILPLVGPPLYQHLGLGWGNTVLGFVGVVFIPVMVLLMKFGERIRKSARFQIDL